MSDFDTIYDSFNTDALPKDLLNTDIKENILFDENDPQEIISKIVDDNIDINIDIFDNNINHSKSKSRSRSRSNISRTSNKSQSRSCSRNSVSSRHRPQNYERSRSRSSSNAKIFDSKDMKDFNFNEYEEYVKGIRTFNYKGVIPEVTQSDSNEKIIMARDKVRDIFNYLNGGSVVKEVFQFGNGILERIFDGSKQIGRFKPDLVGWTDEFEYRMKTDPSIKHAINFCGQKLPNNPLLIGIFKIGIGMLTHMQARSRMRKSPESVINKVIGNITEEK